MGGRITRSHSGAKFYYSTAQDNIWIYGVGRNNGSTLIEKGHVVAFDRNVTTSTSTFVGIRICNKQAASSVAGVASTDIVSGAKGLFVMAGVVTYLKLHDDVTHGDWLMSGSGIEMGHAITWSGTHTRGFAISLDDQGGAAISTEATVFVVPWRL